ncbi:hypothetical protein LRP52_11635 [Photobacterium sp. ZSDE20]|uniref:DUF1127 domain-containing protein n=1 Tax=Photobacterium pectinilyticum TaxID=2906793 RepID=A0ABT1N077_9GAMM|nr:hypothetical protein [Photobacterium sp. ZSDE20]MCQ1058125.1 hypothetical protein [Photobacterium sp. ZSDE20]MDD1822849.1 hypothetical protein [Photobacterium sp. ZSDE20]
MRQSVYLRLAVFLVQLDVKREDAQWRREHRRVQVHLPYHLSAYMLKDIGIDEEQRMAPHLLSTSASRKVRHLRREYKSRLVT